MAETMVTASTGAMNSLLGKLAILMGKEFAKLKNLRKEVKFISDELTGMKDALEGLSYLDKLDPQTKRWRDIVREMSYDIEDIIDDFMQTIAEGNETIGFVTSTIERLRTLRARHKIAGQIKDIKNLVIETSARRQRYKLDTPLYRLDSSLSGKMVTDPRVVTLYENAANLVGVEAPTNELLNLLAGEEKQLKMVSIVGFGGLGKTTLANVVYGRLKGNFNLSSFVSVSQNPDVPKLLHSMLCQLGSTSSYDCELNVLLDQLRERLQNNRYLIVIDDVWDVQTWGIIKCALPENNLGSRVIVTTRIQDVSKACCMHGSDHILEMKPLSNEDSGRLFLDRIFGSEEACPRQLRDTSAEILKRCGGLPLAIISISSMLASECSHQKERWEHVRDSLGLPTNLTLERMREILNLSYRDLPPHLRTCFLYLGMYPEDYKIDRYVLERQWIAEGFISKENGQDAEKLARSYFNELVNRSLIQPVDFDTRGSVTACTVHDMMLDLILIKSREDNFFTILDDSEAITGLDYKIRRLSIRMNGHATIIFPRNISVSQVRTVMLFGNCWNTPSLSEFKFLRVFFSHVISVVINDFTRLCKLYQLRYLHICHTLSYEPSTQISVPKHLETLHMCRVPSDIVHLPSLIHLSIGTSLPDGIGNMKSLRNLNGFDFASNTLDNIKGLGNLDNLRYLVLVCNSPPCEREMRIDVLCDSLGRLSRLESLLLLGMGQIDGLFPFSPPPTPYSLHTLMLQGSWFSRVPSWMGELHNLGELQCELVELLNDGVGILAQLPMLTHLDIEIREETDKMIVIYGRGAFPALRRFKLKWSSSSYLNFQPGAMPKLQRLKLRSWARRLEQNKVAPAGLEHLLALEEFSAWISGVKECDKTSVESALRNAVNMHPSNPRLASLLLD